MCDNSKLENLKNSIENANSEHCCKKTKTKNNDRGDEQQIQTSDTLCYGDGDDEGNEDDKKDGVISLTDSQEFDPNDIDDKEYNVRISSFVDEIRQAAAAAEYEEISSSFEYEPTSGLYYDRVTKYYYDSENGLYYDGNKGCYYKLNQNTNKLENLFSEGLTEHDKVNEKNMKQEKVKECNNTQSEYSKKAIKYDKKGEQNNFNSNRKDHDNSNDVFDMGSPVEEDCFEDFWDHFPSSLRLLVLNTNLLNLKIGTMFIITFNGGTLGREGKNHDVVIPDVNVSKFHLKFFYNEKLKLYQCIDLGSRNGTILNGKRMSSARQESSVLNIEHGSIIQISQTKLLCHMHKGKRTCEDCEPGCIIERYNNKLVNPINDTTMENNFTFLNHKKQLKILKKRYGLDKKQEIGMPYGYKDRAEERRKTIGSSNECEKTQRSSTQIAISNDNKGFKILEKLGWKKGEVLGKNENGLQVPIDLKSNEGTKGLGYGNATYTRI